MKIYNQNWHWAFTPWQLADGEKLAYEGKVSDIKQGKRKIQACVQGRDKSKITILLGKNDEIHQMKCTNEGCRNFRYCKHCAAVLWQLYPLQEEEYDKAVLLNPNEGVESKLPKSASAKEKLEDVVSQLRERYSKKDVHSVSMIERENPKLKRETLNQWSKAATGLTVYEYFLSIDLLKPTIKFEITEEEVSLQDVKGKKCCSIGTNGVPYEWDEELLEKLGAKVVPPTDPDLEYAIINSLDISKEPADTNRDAFFILSMKESGLKNITILSSEFKNKAEEYLKNIEIEETSDVIEVDEESKIVNSVQLPEVEPFADLMYFPKAKKDRKITVDIAGQDVTVINEISYGEKSGEWNQLPKLNDQTYYDVKTLVEKIKDLTEFDYSPFIYAKNYADIEPVEQEIVESDIALFSKVCQLCKSPAVLKLISHAVKRNKNGSLKKRAVTTIIQTQNIPLDLKSKYLSASEFEYYALVAKNTDSEIRLEIRKNPLVTQPNEDRFIFHNQTSPVSEELIEKILQIGEMMENKDV